MSGTVRFGIIGCGLMGREFASAAARWCHLTDDISRPEIVGVCDIDAQRLKNTCDKYHVPQDRRWTGGVLVYREMLDEVKPDGVAVIGQPHVRANR